MSRLTNAIVNDVLKRDLNIRVGELIALTSTGATVSIDNEIIPDLPIMSHVSAGPGDSVYLVKGPQVPLTVMGAINRSPVTPGTLVCRVIRTTPRSVANNTVVNINFSTASYDPFEMWNEESPQNVTPKWPGFFRAAGGMGWESDSSGHRLSQIRKNGGALDLATVRVSAAGANRVMAEGAAKMDGASDSFDLAALQSSGGTLDTHTSLGARPMLEVYYAGPDLTV